MTDFDTFDQREVISEADALALQREGVLAMDPERALPLWFDGRFLTARDLNREQNYFLSRQSAIGKAVGRGVIEGLEVSVDTDLSTEGSRLLIEAGQGVAFDGAHIILPQNLRINLSDLAVQDGLNAQLGLSAVPSAPIRSRSGVFILSLRAVEYTANQTAAFPTHVTGERTTHMGDRIEAVAVTLTPFAPIDAPFDADEARAMAAQRIFQGLEETGAPGHALPIAMLALRNGAIEWLDPHLARRDLVASRRDFLGLGLSRDQMRLAHYNQYQSALADVVAFYRDRGQPARFNAERHFRVLPAAGPMPAATIDPGKQTQLFFPGEIDVELSIVPEDELPALIDDSFELPPIDLTQTAQERDSLSVMVLAPLPRHVLRSQIAHLGALRRPLKPVALLGQGPQKPIDKLGQVRISLAEVAAATEAEADPATEAWAALIRALPSFGTGGDAAQPMLWYVRRRTLRENADLESALAAVDHLDTVPDEVILDPETPVEEPTPEVETETRPRTETDRLGETERRLLLRLSGMGDIAKIAEAQMLRVNDATRKSYVEGLQIPQIAGFPLSVTALTVRVSQLKANESAKTKAAAESLASANVLGVKMLGAALLGEGNVRVTEARFKQLTHFTSNPELLEPSAQAISRLPPQSARELMALLKKAIESGNETATEEVVKEIVSAARRPVRREPVDETPDTTAEDARRAAEERRRQQLEARRRAEAAAKKRADDLVKKIKDTDQQKRLKSLLDRADPKARDSLVRMLDAADIERSRIATGAVLARLASGQRLKIENLRAVQPINKNVVTGLAAIEPHVLAVPRTAPPPRSTSTRGAPAPRTGPARAISLADSRSVRAAEPRLVAQPRIDSRAVALAVATANRNKVTARIQRLANNPGLTSLAAFGNKHRRSSTKLKRGAAELIKALDARNANATTIRNAIVKITREIR